MKQYIISKISAEYLNAGMLTGGLLISFFLNFLFNAYLGRVLSFTDFGIITFIGSFWLILGVFSNALGLTLNHTIIRLLKKENREVVDSFYKKIRKHTFVITSIITVTIILFSYPINALFSLSSPVVVVMLSSLVMLGTFTAANKGYLQSFFKFSHVGILLIIEAVIKLVLAVAFTTVGDTNLVYLSIPLSALSAFLLSEYFLPKMTVSKEKSKPVQFPKHFYFASVLTVLSTTLLFTTDVILAKLYLPPATAGQYAFLSLIGKMIYFFGSLLNTILVSHISKRAEKGKESEAYFYRFLLGVGLMIGLVYAIVGLFGTITLPWFFGDKVIEIAPYLLPYASAIALLTLGNLFVIFHLLHNQFIFPFTALLFSLLIIIGIIFFHTNIRVIVDVISSLSFVSFLVIILLHMNSGIRHFFERRLAFLTAAYE